MNNLPPEMQARLDEIIAQAKQGGAQPETPHQAAIAAPAPMTQEQRANANFGSHAAPVVRQPSLMDHTIALRQEVRQLSQQLHAQGQVTEAVGQAVGQLYAMFCQQTETTDQGATYAAQFQQQTPEDF